MTVKKNPMVTYHKKSKVNKDKMHTIFLDAAIVYIVGGDWKEIFKTAKNKAIGNNKKLLELMQTATTTQMDKFVDDIISHHTFKKSNEYK